MYGDLDAKALALAEGGSARRRACRRFCAIVVSTGIGGGIVLDGELLDGATGNAGHVGHIIVEPNGRRCACGARGLPRGRGVGHRDRGDHRPAADRSRPTRSCVAPAGSSVAPSASLCNVLDLDLVVVGGGVALGFAATFFNAAQEELDRHAACRARRRGRGSRRPGWATTVR